MSRELLAAAIYLEKKLKLCRRHPRKVYFDGPECPCCRLMAERFAGQVRELDKRERVA